MQAPPTHKSAVMSLYFLTTFAGNVLAAVLLDLVPPGVWQFLLCAALMLGASGLFIWCAVHHQPRDFSGFAVGGELQMKQRQSDAEDAGL